MKIAVLASGPSLTDEDVEYVRTARQDGRLNYVIAVSNVGLTKAPWADGMASHDTGWWITHPEYLQFQGRRFSRTGYQHTEKFNVNDLGIPGGLNSGLFAMYLARDVYEASRLYLLGFDMHRRNGQHFFGPHTRIFNNKPLVNTDERRFRIHLQQFERFSGCEVYNCTPDSDLKRFPIISLRDII